MVKHDDYMTPFSAWEDVSAYIPRHLALWEAFYGDGTSGELGKPFVVIMPCSTLTTRYFRDLFPDIQVIVPRRGGAEWAVQLRQPVFLLATRAAEGRGVLDGWGFLPCR
jgi:hypothetical protein